MDEGRAAAEMADARIAMLAVRVKETMIMSYEV